jgi:Tfp pilus assembly protein PilF
MNETQSISLAATGDNTNQIGYIGSIGVFNQTIQITSWQQLETLQLKTTSPYKGLKSFEAVDQKLFFGRNQFLKERFQELEHTNLILILGASGSGKSSLVRAGMVPRLANSIGSQFVNLTLIPNQDPFASFYHCLRDRYPKLDCQMVMEGKPETLVQTVTQLKPKDDFWLIFIDQFEELFTLSQPEKRDRFIAALVQLVKMLDKTPNCSVKIMATMRADFLDRLSPYPELIKRTDQHRPIIAEMQLDELRLAITQPALHHGVVFEAGLVEEIIQDVQGQAGYLPLLQYTLNLLWQTEVETGSIDDRTLNIETYRNLGGVRGTLQKRVDEVYQALPALEQRAAQRVFLKLVEIGGDGAAETEWKPIRRRAYRSEFDDPLEQKVLAWLVNENLLISSHETQSRESTIEIAHEVLLSSWTTLSNWIRENRQAIALRNRLTHDATIWQAKKSKDELWSGLKLEQALELRQDQVFNQVLGGFNQAANKFIDTSLRQRSYQRYKIGGLWTGFSALTILSATLFISLGTPFVARYFNDRGIEALENDNAQEAIKNYNLALRFKPDYPPLLYALGKAYEKAGAFNSAIINYEGAITVSSGKFAPAYSQLAHFYLIQKNEEEVYASKAVIFLEEALKIPSVKNFNQEDRVFYDASKYAILKNLGWAKLKLKRYDEAKNFLDQAIDENKNSKDAKQRGSAHCLLAQVAEAKDQKSEALEEWNSCEQFGAENHVDEKIWIEVAKQRLGTSNKVIDKR